MYLKRSSLALAVLYLVALIGVPPIDAQHAPLKPGSAPAVPVVPAQGPALLPGGHLPPALAAALARTSANKNGTPPMGAQPLAEGSNPSAPVFFTAPLYSSTGNDFYAIAVGDFNGDGNPDLAVVNYCEASPACANGSVSVLLGNGDGTFQTAVSYASGGVQSISLAVGDFNGDGKTDLAVVNECVSSSNCNSGSVSVLLGNGDGTFQAAVSYSTGGEGASSVAVGDFNGDGKLDLAVTNYCITAANCANGVVSVLLGNGDGTFQAPASYASGGQYAASVAVADVNGDGKADLVVANEIANCSSGGSVSVFLGNGDGTFQSSLCSASGGTNDQDSPLAIGDFNGDGRPDVAVVGVRGDVDVLLGNGDGTFRIGASYSLEGTGYVAVGDFNGDGKLDLAVNGSGISVLIGNGDGTFQLPSATYGTTGAFAVGDFNRDGELDVAVAGYSSNVSILLSNGRGGFQAQVNYVQTNDSGASVATGDFNGDGKLDLAAPNPETNEVNVLLGNGDGTFESGVAYPSGGVDSNSITVADVNGDGKPDLIVTNQCGNSEDCTSGSVSVLLGNGDGTFQPVVSYASGGSTTRFTAVGDFNGDGKLDLAVVSACVSSDSCSNGVVSILLGNGDGSFQPAVSYNSGGADSISVAVGDFNGDGKPDVVVANLCGESCVAGTVSVFLGNGDGTLQMPQTFASGGSEPTSVVVADFNGDGNLDLALANYESSPVNILLGNGDGTFQAPASYASGQGLSEFVVVGDFNGDGKPDLALGGNSEELSVSVLLGNGDGSFQAPTNYFVAGAPSFAAVGDFNGDGKPDLAVADGGITVLLNITPSSSTTRLSSSLNPEVYGQAVTLTATVTSSGSGTPTGSVTFTDGGNTLGTAPVSGGAATLSTTALSVGSHSITATYSGDSNFTASTSAAYTLTVNQAASSVSLISTLYPPTTAAYGEPVTFTATVYPQYGGMATGTLSLSDGGTVIRTQPVGLNSAALIPPLLAVGSHSITASYSGDANVAASSSPVLMLTVNKASTTSSVTSSANPSLVGEAVTFTVSVAPQFTSMPTGTVTLKRNGAPLATLTLNGRGQASYTTSSLGLGSTSITASYSGDSNFTTSTSAALTQVVQKEATTTVVTSSANPITEGQSVTFAATVSSGSGAPPDGEVVTFKNGSTTLGTGSLSGGVATFTTSSLAAGSTSIRAAYSGDATFATSTSAAITETVNKYGTTAMVASNANPSSYGQSVTFTATVSASAGGTPTGTVTFKNGSATLGTATLSGGTVSFSTSTLTVATHSITAVYGGDATHAGSTSAALSEVVNKAATMTTVASSQNPSTSGQSVTFTATVTSSTTGAPTGSVIFKAGTRNLGSASVSGGTASVSTTTLAAGSDTITATYNGSADYAGSSATLTQTVN